MESTLALRAPRTPSPTKPGAKSNLQPPPSQIARQSSDTDSPYTPASVDSAAPKFQDTPITPYEACAAPRELASDSPSVNVKLKSLQLQDRINHETQGADPSQILLFKSPEPLAELKFGDIIGRGQWSKVHRSWIAVPRPTADREALAPANATVFAAKVADGRSAVKVIRHEARILTYLESKALSHAYTVGFFGYEMQRNALILEHLALPHALGLVEAWRTWPIRCSALTRGLVDGLDFLHEAGVIHGDIKPGNIYVRRLPVEALGYPSDVSPKEMAAGASVSTSFTFQPVYADFSASRFDRPDSFPTESAGTYNYMAPELFSTLAGGSFPTAASDVYALGLSLVSMAAGCSPYDIAPNAITRRVMAIQGTPLQFLSADMSAWQRFEASGLRPYVQGAIAKEAKDRWTARSWKEKVF